MNEAEERAKFEAWATKHYTKWSFERWPSGEYRWALLETAWRLWQARAALAEPAAEPVAWMFVDDTGMMFVSVDKPHADYQPLYAAPPVAAPTAQDEPVAWAISYDGKTPYSLWHDGDGALLDLEVKRLGGSVCKLALYAAPPPVAAPTVEKAPGFCKHCRQYTIEEPLAASTVPTEPVAWITPGQDLHLANPEGFRFSDWIPLFAAPPPVAAPTVPTEPVAWASPSVIPLREGKNNHPCVLTDTKCGANTVPLYAAPPPVAAPTVPTEPVAWVFKPNRELLWPSEVEVTNPIEIDEYLPLVYATPPRAPLTEEKILGLATAEFPYWSEDIQSAFVVQLARAIEAAHGIKESE